MPGLLADPRVAAQAIMQQRLQQGLYDPLSQQMMQRRMGGIPQGLLDRSNSPTGILGPPTVRPDIQQGGGLLTPVIWNRIQQQLGLTEGARTAEGGGRGYQPQLDLQGGAGPRPHDYKVTGGGEPDAKHDFKLDWRSYGRDQMTHRAVTKSGVRVVMSKDPYDGGTVDVLFDAPQGVAKGSTQRGISRFEEVYGAVKDYVQGFSPERLRFTGLTDKHDKLYDRVAPLMAKHLGGELTMPSKPGGNYTIDLPR